MWSQATSALARAKALYSASVEDIAKASNVVGAAEIDVDEARWSTEDG